MKHTTVSGELEKIEFAKKAALHFSTAPDHWSFGEIKPGSFVALRWGLGDDCVLVLKLDEDFEPTVYGQLIAAVPADSEPTPTPSPEPAPLEYFGEEALPRDDSFAEKSPEIPE